MQRDPSPPHPFDAPVDLAPATLRPVLRSAVRGAASEQLCLGAAAGADRLFTWPGTVRDRSPQENSIENTAENTSENRAAHRRERITAPPSARDAELLLFVVRLRFASVQQIAQTLFAEVSTVVARRRIRALVRDGWLQTWDRPLPTGGSRRYVYPTTKTLGWAYARILADASTTPAAQLVHLMVPHSMRRLLRLPANGVPQWLPHQEEINRLVLARTRAGDVPWFSSWDCPFPDRLNGLRAPQPDYMLVRSTAEGPALVFGEHDRGTEPLITWADKLASYAAARAMSADLFGFASFDVDVTVTDSVAQQPVRRLRAIADAVVDAGYQAFVRLTLAGWAHADAAGAVWFTHGARPAHDALRPSTHALRR